MLFKLQTLILCLLLAGSTVTWAGVTQTARFTLSVTIPERAQAPDAASVSNPNSTIPLSQPRMDMHSEIRGQSLVFVISYVVN